LQSAGSICGAQCRKFGGSSGAREKGAPWGVTGMLTACGMLITRP
jgi:hypothetical protein